MMHVIGFIELKTLKDLRHSRLDLESKSLNPNYVVESAPDVSMLGVKGCTAKT